MALIHAFGGQSCFDLMNRQIRKQFEYIRSTFRFRILESTLNSLQLNRSFWALCKNPKSLKYYLGSYHIPKPALDRPVLKSLWQESRHVFEIPRLSSPYVLLVLEDTGNNHPIILQQRLDYEERVPFT